jgi:hypothetical protein
MWLVQLEERIPNTTPSGHPNNSICFLLRIAGGEEFDHLDLYGALSFKVRDDKGNVLEGDYSGNQVRPVALEDIIGLHWTRTQQICNLIYLDGDTLVICDGYGGGLFFHGIRDGATLHIDVTFDATTQSENERLANAERSLGFGDAPFFRGAIHCGALTLHIGKAKPVPHKKDPR